MSRLVIGVDSGGTQTRAVVMNEARHVIGKGISAGGNHNAIGREQAVSHIQHAVLAAIENAGVQTEHIEAIGLGVAGAPAERELAWLCTIARAVLPHAVLVPSSDVEIAMVGALGTRHGMLILSGTGSIVYGVNESGQSARAGGWGYLLGDEGSGFAIGQAALRAICRARDGIGESATLTDKVLTHLKLKDTTKLVEWTYGGDSPQTRIASLAVLVLDAADTGDPKSIMICTQAVSDLLTAAEAVAARLELRSGQYSLAGGLLDWDGSFAERVRAEMMVRLPGLQSVTPRYNAVIGAALLALERMTDECT